MVIVVIVVAAVVVALLLAGLALLVAVARSLVAPVRERRMEYELLAPGLVAVPSTAETRLPGRFGLTVGGGHLRVGDFATMPVPGAAAAAFGHRVMRSVEVGREPVISSGSGWWRRDVFLDPGQASLLFTDVSIPTELGAAPSWLVRSAGGRDSGVWAVHLHGIRTKRSVTIPTVLCASRAGLVSLVPSWRNDGEGPACRRPGSMLGQSESRDVEAAIGYAVDHGARWVILVGWSMGGQIALRLAGMSRHRDRIAGLLLIAPVTSWRAVLRNAIAAARLPGIVASAVTELLKRRWFALFAGVHAPVDLDTLDAQAQPADLEVPCLVIHNRADQLVPFRLSEELLARLNAQESERKEFVELDVFGDSPHALEWNCNPERFEARVTTWLSAVAEQLGEPGAAQEERGAIPDGS